MPITAVQSNGAMDDGLPTTATDVPAWMLNRRERRSSGEPPVTEPPVTESPFPDSSADISFPLTLPPSLPRTKPKAKPPVVKLSDSDVNANLSKDNWWTQWTSKQGLIGMAVSLFVHSTALAALAFIIMSNVSTQDEVQLWGVAGQSDEIGDTILIDTSDSSDSGESAPLQMTDVGQVFDSIGSKNEAAESMRVGSGGNGKGEGSGGNGLGTGGLTLKVPAHAQTKGSFSAWPEPRDPKPLEDYFIVIQVRVPRTAKRYRSSDLSGLVTGTDGYHQKIRFKAGDTVPIEEGTVEIRIHVPGGAQRVRDTIHLESKMLKEEQTFEIEF